MDNVSKYRSATRARRSGRAGCTCYSACCINDFCDFDCLAGQYHAMGRLCVHTCGICVLVDWCQLDVPTALVVLNVFVHTGNQTGRAMTPVLFMAPVGLATADVEAGSITIFGAEMSSRLAVPMTVVGCFVVGIAFSMAIILYTIYFHQLLAAGWSTPAIRAALFILKSGLYSLIQSP
jgi:hypothetical protein